MTRQHSMQILLLLFVVAFGLSVSAQQTSPKKGLEVITREKLQLHIDYLASDALLGRNTPSAGLDTAAAYIAREFKKYGIQPVNGTYFQPVPLIIRSLGTGNAVEVTSGGVTRPLKIKTDFVPYEFSGSGLVTGSLVFAGYGITAPEYNYDDYAGIDVKGKIVVVLRHEPGENDTASVFMGTDNTTYAFNETKAANAIAHGAVGIIVVTDPLNHQITTPRGFPWPSLSKILPHDALPMILSDTTQKVPVVHAGKEIISELFGSFDSLRVIQMEIDKNLKPMSKAFPDIMVTMNVVLDENIIKANNVIGIIPGSDPSLRSQYLVVGGHYDHVGFNRDQQADEDSINNGADDNASGTAGVLAVAEAFSKMNVKPKRSVLFMAFSGEEKGLFGSEAYVRKPLFPLSNTVAMLNLDMISRNSIDTLYLDGGVYSPDLTEIVKTQNKGVGFKLQINKDDHVAGSDHASFFQKKVPFVFFFAGLHDDYHSVRDNPDTIDPDKAARISQLVFKTAWFVANDSKRYKIIEKK